MWMECCPHFLGGLRQKTWSGLLWCLFISDSTGHWVYHCHQYQGFRDRPQPASHMTNFLHHSYVECSRKCTDWTTRPLDQLFIAYVLPINLHWGDQKVCKICDQHCGKWPGFYYQHIIIILLYLTVQNNGTTVQLHKNEKNGEKYGACNKRL